MVPEPGLLGLLDLDRVNKKRIGLILTLTLIPKWQRTKKKTARSTVREGERGKGMGGGSPELDRRPPVANPNRVKH